MAILFPTANAFCLAALLGTSWVLPARAETPSPNDEASAHVQAGVSAMRANTRDGFKKAYGEFKAAYELNSSSKSLANLGMAAAALELDGEAIDALTRFTELGAGDVRAGDQTTVRAQLERLKLGSATVKLEAPGFFSIVDTRLDPTGDVVNEYGPFEGRAELRVRAGVHEIELAGADLVAPKWRGDLRRRDVVSHAFATVLEPAPVGELAGTDSTAVPADSVSPPPTHTIPYVLWGAGAAATVAATVVLLESSRLQRGADEDFASRCPLGATGEPGCEIVTAKGAKAANWRTGALLTGVGALGLLVTGTVYYFIESRPAPVASATEASIQPWLGLTGAGVSGTF